MMGFQEKDAEKLIFEQKRYFHSGKTLDVGFRIENLKKLAEAIQKNEAELIRALKADLGKSEFEAYAAEIGFVLTDIRHTIRSVRRWGTDKRVKTPMYLAPGKSRIRKEPYGTVLILGPYNYPFQLLIDPLVGAIAAGNCAILKPSEMSLHVSAVVKKMITQTFDPKYIACVEGGIEENRILLDSPVDYIFFTGSVRVGKIVMQAAAKKLIPVTLELGGKSPVIVEKSADIPEAARRIMWGKLMNAGQTCVAPDYILVDETKKEQLIGELIKTVIRMYGENAQESPDYGRIVNGQHFSRIREILERDHECLVHGGRMNEADRYIEPAILDLTKGAAGAASMEEEIFGPVLPVLSYKKLEDAVRFINAGEKPLALYLFTRKKSAEKFVLERTSSGGVSVNDTISHLINPALPFGGVGASGVGQYHGRHSFDTFTHERSVFKKPAKLNIPVCYPPFNSAKNKMVRFILK